MSMDSGRSTPSGLRALGLAVVPLDSDSGNAQSPAKEEQGLHVLGKDLKWKFVLLKAVVK